MAAPNSTFCVSTCCTQPELNDGAYQKRPRAHRVALCLVSHRPSPLHSPARARFASISSASYKRTLRKRTLRKRTLMAQAPSSRGLGCVHHDR